MRVKCDIAVVGAGVLGVTTAFWLTELYDCSVAVLEAAGGVALHTTLRNTGIAHRPYYLDPEKKRLFARSAEMSFHLWRKLAAARGLPWKELGTLMVGTEEWQLAELEKYRAWGVENGMDEREYELLSGVEVRKVEPDVSCLGAILSRRDASTDFAALTREVWAMASANGARLMAGSRAEKVEAGEAGLKIKLANGEVECSLLVNAAGGRSLDIAHSVGLAKEYTDLHFRGDYWVVDPARVPTVGRNLYSVARHREYPFLDPHFVVRADGRREVGPNAALVAGPEVYQGLGGPLGVLSKIAERPLGPKARLFADGDFLSLVWDEWRSAFSKRAMCERVRRFLPSLTPDMLSERGLPGVRSSLVGRDGFAPEAVVLVGRDSIHVLNYNSPGATGAPVFSANLVRTLQRSGMLDAFHAKPKKEGAWGFDATQIE